MLIDSSTWRRLKRRLLATDYLILSKIDSDKNVAKTHLGKAYLLKKLAENVRTKSGARSNRPKSTWNHNSYLPGSSRAKNFVRIFWKFLTFFLKSEKLFETFLESFWKVFNFPKLFWNIFVFFFKNFQTFFSKILNYFFQKIFKKLTFGLGGFGAVRSGTCLGVTDFFAVLSPV